jgi:ADP-heptose:LPS heptosyltransferase
MIKKNKIQEILSIYFLSTVFYIIRNIVHYRKTNNNIAVIIALRKLGDAVFTIPAVKEVQKNVQGKLFLICFPETEPVYRTALTDVNIITLGHNGFYFNDRIAKLSSRRLLAKLQPGTIIDLTGVITSAMLIYTSKASTIIGTNEKYFRTIYSEYIPEPEKVHMMDQYLSIVKRHFNIHTVTSSKEFRCVIKADGFILIHPFAGWKAKEWDFSKFVSLAKYVNSEYNCLMVFPSGYIDNHLFTEVNAAGIKIEETKNVDELISIINNCSVFISNDSGPLQIAALLGKPTFTIYGPTNPEYHLPFGEHHSFIQKIISCSPKKGEKFCHTDAGRDGCPAFKCMNQLSVEEVYPQVMNFLSKLNIQLKVKQALNL